MAGALHTTNTLETTTADALVVLEAEAALDGARADRVAERYEQLAASVEVARTTLRDARAVAGSEWESRYLEAEDRVLVAVREYAEAADRLARAVSERCITVAEGDQASPLTFDRHALSQEEVARARRRRQVAATEVEAATAAAARLLASRPA